LSHEDEVGAKCSGKDVRQPRRDGVVTAVIYHDRDALTRTRDQGAAICSATLTEVGPKMLDIGEFELTLARLHVPEMAATTGRSARNRAGRPALPQPGTARDPRRTE
jgi:hypothetical protein